MEWIFLPDATTALNALQTGELDIFEECPPDLVPVVARNRNLRLSPQDGVGVQPTAGRAPSGPGRFPAC